jgi:glycosyltransferase involved in cell wall biosynthesis
MLCCHRSAEAQSYRNRTVRVQTRAVPRSPARKLSVAVVGVTGNFLWDDDGRPDDKVRLSGSGAARAAWAMFSYIDAHEEATLIALADRDGAPSLGAMAPVRERRWSGIRVLHGGSCMIREALRSKGIAFDVALAADLHSDVVRFVLDLPARRVYATAHSYQELPYGPLSVLLHDPSCAHVRPKLEQQASLLAQLTLITPSESVAAYADRYGATSSAAVTGYAASYGFFCPRPHRHDLFDGQHDYVTCISPCPHKGLSVLLGVARALPHVRFAAVTTAWTQEEDRLMLKLEPNVTLLEPNVDVDAIYARTRILLAPSVWAEAFGLVVVEAGLRGIPCISSDSGGLPEANPLPSLVVKTPLVYDVPRYEPLAGCAHTH